MKVRLKFSKAGSMKFIGHLDVMRYFQKAFRRSKIAVSYSQGFSPHQLLSFAAPLGLGLTSDGEYLDMQLDSIKDPKLFLDQINASMNEEIRVTDYVVLSEQAKNAMSLTAAADYIISLKDGYESDFDTEFPAKFHQYLNQDTIMVVKKTKRSEKISDIKPMILKFAFSKEEFQKKGGSFPKATCSQSYENGQRIFLQLAAGSKKNLKPELVLEGYFHQIEKEYNPYAYQIHRLELYGEGNHPSEYIPLIQIT